MIATSGLCKKINYRIARCEQFRRCIVHLASNEKIPSDVLHKSEATSFKPFVWTKNMHLSQDAAISM